MRPLGACHSTLALTKERYTLPRLLVSIARREETAQRNGLFTGNGLRVMLEGKDYYAADMFFPFTASVIDKSLGFEGRCELTKMSLKFGDTADKVLDDHRYEFVGGGGANDATV